jgi:hypothetical protein
MKENANLADLIDENIKKNAEKQKKEFQLELMQIDQLTHQNISSILSNGITNKKKLQDFYESGLLKKFRTFGKVALNGVEIYLGLADLPKEICEKDIEKYKQKLKAIRGKIEKLSAKAKMINESLALFKRKKRRDLVSQKAKKDKEIINRFIKGESMAKIAREQGVSSNTIRQRIFSGWKNGYKEHYIENNRGDLAVLRKIPPKSK